MTNLWEWKSDRGNSKLLRSGLGLLYAVSLVGGTIGSIYGFMGKQFPAVANGLIDTFQTQGMTLAQRKEHYQLKWQRDLKVATAAIAKDPNDVKAYRQRFRLHRILQNDRAIASYTQHIAHSPNSAFSVYVQRAKLYAKKGEKKLALADLDYLRYATRTSDCRRATSCFYLYRKS